MELSKSIKLLELQTKIIYNLASEDEIMEFENFKKNITQAAIGSLKWYKTELETLKKMYLGDLINK